MAYIYGDRYTQTLLPHSIEDYVLFLELSSIKKRNCRAQSRQKSNLKDMTRNPQTVTIPIKVSKKIRVICINIAPLLNFVIRNL